MSAEWSSEDYVRSDNAIRRGDVDEAYLDLLTRVILADVQPDLYGSVRVIAQAVVRAGLASRPASSFSPGALSHPDLDSTARKLLRRAISRTYYSTLFDRLLCWATKRSEDRLRRSLEQLQAARLAEPVPGTDGAWRVTETVRRAAS